MPTLGWVQEGAWERVLTATETPPEPAKAGPRTFRCPFCNSFHQSAITLQEHLGHSHRVARPVMLVHGKELDHIFTLRQKLGPADIGFFNTTRVSLSIDNNAWQVIPEADVWRALAKTTMARVRLRIENAPRRKAAARNWPAFAAKGSTAPLTSPGQPQVTDPEPVSNEYDFTIRIASGPELIDVEHAYDEHLNIANFSRDSVGAFLSDTRCNGVSGDYASGIAAYAFGVLVKEGRPDAGLVSPLAQYSEHFGSALRTFEVHSRPLPRLLSAFMRFSLNDFSQAKRPCGHRVLDHACAALADPANAEWSSVDANTDIVRTVPIDEGTDRVLRLAEKLFSAARWTPVLKDECRQVSEAGTLVLTDQQKATALWALAALRHGATRDAIEPLQRIAATYPFSTWASSTLDAVTA